MALAHKDVVLAAIELQNILRLVSRTVEESILLAAVSTFIYNDDSTGPKRRGNINADHQRD